MKRWALVTLGLYLAALLAAAGPLAEACFGRDVGPHAIYYEFYRSGWLWLWCGVFVAAQVLLLSVPVRQSVGRPVARRHVLAAVAASAFLFVVLFAAFACSLASALWGDAALGYTGTRVTLAIIGILWIFWAALFWWVYATRRPHALARRLRRWLLPGSILELLVAVPSHVIVRRRDDCCAPGVTFLGIATGLSVMLLAFGPGILFLFVARARRLRPRGEPARSEDDRTPPGAPAPETDERAERALRALGRCSVATLRWPRLGSVLVLALLYLGLALATVVAPDAWDGIQRWNLFAMAVLPAWASLVVLVTCSTAFASEREAGTLDALRLAPNESGALVRALLRPRLRAGLLVLLAGLPLYVLPHNAEGISSTLSLYPWPDRAAVHVGVLSTVLRPFYAAAALSGRSSSLALWQDGGLSGLSGLGAFLVDATRLYALAVIGLAVSLRTRTGAGGLVRGLGAGGLFAALTVGAESLGGWLVEPSRTYIGPGILMLLLGALLLEVGVLNLIVPDLVRRWLAARAERLLADSGG